MSWPEYHVFYLEPSRSPQGVAMSTCSVELWADCQAAAVEHVLWVIGDTAAGHHGMEMIPSRDAADYLWRPRASIHLFLRHDHPWWQGPVAARVARRNGCTAEQWRQRNHLAYEHDVRPDQVIVPSMLVGLPREVGV